MPLSFINKRLAELEQMKNQLLSKGLLDDCEPSKEALKEIDSEIERWEAKRKQIIERENRTE